MNAESIAYHLNTHPVEYSYNGNRDDAEKALGIIERHTFTESEIESVIDLIKSQGEISVNFVVNVACHIAAKDVDKNLNLETVTFYVSHETINSILEES